MTTKKYQLGIDVCYNGYCVVSQGKNIIDICPYPQKLKNNNTVINEIKKHAKQKNIEYFSQRYGKNFKSFGKTLEKQVKQELKEIDMQTTRDYEMLESFFYKYGKDIEMAIIEKPLQQTAMKTTINSLVAGHATLEVYRYLLTINYIPYVITGVNDWRKHFDYKDIDNNLLLKYPKKDHHKIKKQHNKSESIRIAESVIENIKDWYIPKGCRKINDSIVEASLLSILEIDKTQYNIY